MSLTVYENGTKDYSKEFSDKPPVQNLKELYLKYPNGGYAGMHVLVYSERCYYAWYVKEQDWLPLNGTISKEDLHACQKAIITLQELKEAHESLSLEMTTRESSRENNENVRLENETVRTQKEIARENDEVIRNRDEITRNQNENNRINQENQRLTSENTRLDEDEVRARQIITANDIITSTVNASKKADIATEEANTIIDYARGVIDETNIAKTEANNAALAANLAKDSSVLATIETTRVKDETIIVKNDTIAVRDETIIVKNDTIAVRDETIIAKDAAILATENANIASADMLSNLISLEIKDDMSLSFKTPDNYNGITFKIEEGNLIAMI